VGGGFGGRTVTTPRRRLLAALLRAGLTSTVLVVLYYRLPLTGPLDGSAAALLVAGLALFVGIISWQLRSILRSDYPALRAIEGLAAAIPLFLLVFAAAYLKLADAQEAAFSEPLSRTDSLYFTITVFATVGFGDITPVITSARILVMIQMVGDLLVVGLVLRAMLEAVRQGRERRGPGPPAAAESPDPGDAGAGPGPYLARHDRPGT
jgi:voltage-gated potassium channel